MPYSSRIPTNIGRPSLKEQLLAEKAQRNLADFTKQAWHIIEPSTDYIHGWAIDAISEHLMAVSAGQIRDLLINIPPRHTKSISVACMWPCWEWITQPHIRWMFASYSLQLSERDSRKCLDIITDRWYQRNFGDAFKLRHTTQRRFENDHHGYRLAVSTTSAATGEGGDRVVCDDPHNALEADSSVKRNKVLDWWDRTMSTRVNSAKTGSRVIVMQRLHQNDLSGHLLSQGGWVHLNLPAEFEPSRRTFTSIGWSDPRKEEGELLWPERNGPEEIEKAKKQLGPYGYAGQFQQRPVPAGGATFRQEWIRRYRLDGNFVTLIRPDGQGEKSYAIKDCRRIATVDIASRLKESADYTVIATWLITPGNELILRDVIRMRLTNPEQQDAILLAHARWRYESVNIEDVAYQLALIQQLLPKGVPCMPFHPISDKVSRASTAAIFYSGGLVYHPLLAPWLDDFELELLTFPKAEHDDCVDVVSMACELLFEGGDIPTGATGSANSQSAIIQTNGMGIIVPRHTVEDEKQNDEIQHRQDTVANILSVLNKLNG